MIAHERFSQLNRLTLFRLFIISALLFLTQRDWVPLENAMFSPRAMSWLVGGFFLLSLGYLLWLRQHWKLDLLARVQCAVDPVLITLLVILTGGLGSPFHFLYGLAVLNTALLLGRRAALLTAGVILLLTFLAISLPEWLPTRSFETDWHLLRRILVHGTAFLLTAWLGGALTERASRLQMTLEQQRDSLADLASLNQQVVNAMPYGLVSINRQGVIRSVNDSVGDLLAVRPAFLVGRRLQEIFPQLTGMAGLGEEPNTDYREFPHETRILGVTLSPLRDHRRQFIGVLLVVRDLSDQKRMEREMAEQAKLALMGRMAAYLAHEIRNPLASILSAAQMLQRSENPGQRQRLEGIILEEVARLNQLTTDILLFARPADPRRTSVDLADFLTDLQPVWLKDPRFGESRRLTLAVAIGVRVRFDLNHLRQVLWNLLLNAAQATDEQGEITLTVLTGAEQVRMIVRDNGLGLAEDLLSQATEPFFTTRSNGTGLGLAVVAQLMRLNGGQVSLSNHPSGGLAVQLTMEAANGPDPHL